MILLGIILGLSNVSGAGSLDIAVYRKALLTLKGSVVFHMGFRLTIESNKFFIEPFEMNGQQTFKYNLVEAKSAGLLKRTVDAAMKGKSYQRTVNFEKGVFAVVGALKGKADYFEVIPSILQGNKAIHTAGEIQNIDKATITGYRFVVALYDYPYGSLVATLDKNWKVIKIVRSNR